MYWTYSWNISPDVTFSKAPPRAQNQPKVWMTELDPDRESRTERESQNLPEHRNIAHSRNGRRNGSLRYSVSDDTFAQPYDNSISYIDSEVHIDGDTRFYTNGHTFRGETSSSTQTL